MKIKAIYMFTKFYLNFNPILK